MRLSDRMIYCDIMTLILTHTSTRARVLGGVCSTFVLEAGT